MGDYRSDNKYVTSFLLTPTVTVVNSGLQGGIKIRGCQDLLRPIFKGKVTYLNPNTTAIDCRHMRAIYSMHYRVSDMHQL